VIRLIVWLSIPGAAPAGTPYPHKEKPGRDGPGFPVVPARLCRDRHVPLVAQVSLELRDAPRLLGDLAHGLLGRGLHVADRVLGRRLHVGDPPLRLAAVAANALGDLALRAASALRHLALGAAAERATSALELAELRARLAAGTIEAARRLPAARQRPDGVGNGLAREDGPADRRVRDTLGLVADDLQPARLRGGTGLGSLARRALALRFVFLAGRSSLLGCGRPIYSSSLTSGRDGESPFLRGSFSID
jgi:hypothetical protein